MVGCSGEETKIRIINHNIAMRKTVAASTVVWNRSNRLCMLLLQYRITCIESNTLIIIKQFIKNYRA